MRNRKDIVVMWFPLGRMWVIRFPDGRSDAAKNKKQRDTFIKWWRNSPETPTHLTKAKVLEA